MHNQNYRVDFEQIKTYVGLPYVVGQTDCADLFLKVQREVFSRKDFVPFDNAHGITGARQRRQIRHALAMCAKRLSAPEHGCLVLFGPASRGLWHMGTVCSDGAELWILHASRIAGSAELTRMRDMASRGYMAEGYYTWK